MKVGFKGLGWCEDNDFDLKICGLLVGRKIVEVHTIDDQTGELLLDNDVVVRVEGNEGCDGCGNGWYYLTQLLPCDNIITHVECENDNEEIYRICVFAEDEKTVAVQFNGYDNGWYGVGFHVYVKRPTAGGAV